MRLDLREPERLADGHLRWGIGPCRPSDTSTSHMCDVDVAVVKDA